MFQRGRKHRSSSISSTETPCSLILTCTSVFVFSVDLMSTAAAFLSEVPGWFLWTGVFFPVTALLLLLIALLSSMKITMNNELSVYEKSTSRTYIIFICNMSKVHSLKHL
uniref:Uncharacterized protein n=1 Tax=Sinocyclocheilus anshuiensis TaxID=1608454 RepID=A0A671K982_9TELE